MAETIEDYKKKVAVLEQKLRLFELPGEMRGYYTLQRLINIQADFLDEFDLDKEIKMYSKDDKLYDRASDMWEKLPVLISRVNALKLEIKATGDESGDIIKNTFKRVTTPESIADHIGELAGKIS